MILGEFRGHFPRITLTLPGIQGEVEVEFIVETGFDGDLALPEILLNQLVATVPVAADNAVMRMNWLWIGMAKRALSRS